MSRFVVKDSFFQKAKKDGYRARSAYKLIEIQDKFKIVKKGNAVLDLGCSPGSFLQVIASIVGPEGKVVGVDILPTAPLPQRQVIPLVQDIRALDPAELTTHCGKALVDVITCDIAPNLSGIKEVDDRNVNEIYEAVRGIVAKVLRKGGNFVIKSFFSESLKGVQKDLGTLFGKVTLYKPTASRSVSSEVYFVCTGKK